MTSLSTLFQERLSNLNAFEENKDVSLHVLEMNEAFEEVDGRFSFSGTLIVYQANTELHHAFLEARCSSLSDVTAESLTNDIRIPVEAYNPLFPSELTRAPDPLPINSFIKKPQLISYDRICLGSQPTLIAESLLEEATVCELLIKHRHPNIAAYFGCQVSDGRIIGLCFARYQRTLMQEVNPIGLMKRESRAMRCRNTKDYSGVLAGIESGIRHLHSLGLVHNDINPSNIMLDGDQAIIIDFGSCRPVGESLQGVGRTYEWYDEAVQKSVPENDLNALKEICTWLGDDSQQFQFGE
jgi:Protein kinase domain